ncbi:hypothetical protein TWF173_001882 [Orbilia oligospora]|nr:hypothetical protein TWF173_001882 [Orbilia oligospora]
MPSPAPASERNVSSIRLFCKNKSEEQFLASSLDYEARQAFHSIKSQLAWLPPFSHLHFAARSVPWVV